MAASLVEKLLMRAPGICLYGFAPPKRSTPTDQLHAIVEHQLARLETLPLDGVIIYDIQDEAERIADPRPFPFLPTIDPEIYAEQHLAALPLPKIVYRCISRDTPDTFSQWAGRANASATPRMSVLVGAPSRSSQVTLHLNDAYALAQQHAANLLIGGVTIAERHGKCLDEHRRILAKSQAGCSFFVTQAIYDVASTKSLLSDYALALSETASPARPIILTFSPCGTIKTLEFMKWLGISFPRWLENDLRFAADPLTESVDCCERIFVEIFEYAREKKIPVGVNVESVSIRKAEIDASIALLHRLHACMR